MKFYIAILAGALLGILFKLNKAYTLPDFTGKSFLKLNWISTLINVVIGVILVYAKDEIEILYKITFISALVLGTAGQFVFKGIIDAASPGVSTAIGLNDKTDTDG